MTSNLNNSLLSSTLSPICNARQRCNGKQYTASTFSFRLKINVITAAAALLVNGGVGQHIFISTIYIWGVPTPPMIWTTLLSPQSCQLPTTVGLAKRVKRTNFHRMQAMTAVKVTFGILPIGDSHREGSPSSCISSVISCGNTRGSDSK